MFWEETGNGWFCFCFVLFFSLGPLLAASVKHLSHSVFK